MYSTFYIRALSASADTSSIERKAIHSVVELSIMPGIIPRGGVHVWHPQLCYSEAGVDGEIQYHPGYLIFYRTHVQITPCRRQERRGTGYFHPLPLSSFSLEGNFMPPTQYNRYSFPLLQPALGPLYLTEAAQYMVEQYIGLDASPSVDNQNAAGELEGEHNVSGVLEGEQRVRNWPLNFTETTTIDVGKSSLHQSLTEGPSSTAGEVITSDSLRMEALKISCPKDIIIPTSPTCMERVGLDASAYVDPSILSQNKEKSRPGKDVGGLHKDASLDLVDEEHQVKEECHLQCQKERVLCAHPCPLPCHPGDCPPCTFRVKSGCHCNTLVLTFDCDVLTSASDAERVSLLSCRGPCHRMHSTCAHMCSDTCHPGDCQMASNCSKKVTVRCACQRLKNKWLCCDVQKAQACGKSSGKARSQGGKSTNLIPCDQECLLLVKTQEAQNETEVPPQKKGKEVQDSQAFVRRRRKSRHHTHPQDEETLLQHLPSIVRRLSITGGKIVLVILTVYLIVVGLYELNGWMNRRDALKIKKRVDGSC